MKRVTICIVAFAAGAAATSAPAAHFAPKGTRFQLSGTVDMSKTSSKQEINCPYTFGGRVTSDGTIEITKANFCKEVRPSELPWTWQATGARPKDGIASMAFSIKAHDCGEVNSEIFLRNGFLQFTAAVSTEKCELWGGSGIFTPIITIKP